MTRQIDFEALEHDPRDPNPWLALYLDRSTPIDLSVKEAWLRESSSRCRQFVLPVVRPLARLTIILFQLVKIVLPDAVTLQVINCGAPEPRAARADPAPQLVVTARL